MHVFLQVVTKRKSGNLGVKSGYNLFFAATIEDVSKENPNLSMVKLFIPCHFYVLLYPLQNRSSYQAQLLGHQT